MFTNIVLVIQIKMSETKNVLFQEPMRFIKSIIVMSAYHYILLQHVLNARRKGRKI